MMNRERRTDFAASLLLAAFCFPACDAALLSEGWRLQSPCDAAVAAEVGGAKAATAVCDNVHWVAVFPGLKPLQTAMLTLPTNPTSVGTPSAVARLDKSAGRLDYLRSSIPKENPEAADVLGLALDGCIEAWLEHCAAEGATAKFEDLQASSTPQSAAVLSTRGFAELDDVAVDFTALGRGECIPTHRARLPGAIVAYERRAGACDDVLDQSMAQALLGFCANSQSPSTQRPSLRRLPRRRRIHGQDSRVLDGDHKIITTQCTF